MISSQSIRADAGSVARRAPVAIAIAAVVAASLVACGSSSASPSASGAAGSVAPAATAPAATPVPTPVTSADTLRVGTPGGPVRDSMKGLDQLHMASAVFDFLYRFDAHFGAVPDLADGECFVPGADGTVIRCRIVETTFHDGTPLTAGDVAYSYRLFGPLAGFTNLREVRVVDPRTVDFVLESVDASFFSHWLAAIGIVSQRAVEASYAAFLAATKGDTAESLTALADTIEADLARDPPVCSPHVEAVAGLLEQFGVPYYREDYRGTSGEFAPCDYVGAATEYIRAAAKALGATGLDAVGYAFPVLADNWRPIGTGPYRFVSEDADRVHLEAFAGYHGGLAATRNLDFVRTEADGSDLLDGTVDIFQGAPHDIAFQAAAASRGVRFATVLNTSRYYFLAFNVREGRPFSDVNLRQALQLCIDLERDVDAATGGNGTPIYGPVPPDSWAYDPDLPKLKRDVAAARRLIEASGWQLGADGVYARDGVRLAAPILVRAERPPRITMADLVAAQARDCGMDLRTLSLREDVYEPALAYPLHVPGTKTPWDLFLYGWGISSDPPLYMYTSSEIVSATHPDGSNTGGFSDAAVDRLDAAQASTYDQAERARLLRQEQQEIAAQVPVLFLWIDTSHDAVRSAVATVDGPLDLAVPNWRVQLSRMVVANP